MVARWFARWGGALMIVFAVVAFLYPGSSVGLSPINLDVSYGYFLGIDPMNILNKLLLVFLGIAGFISAERNRTKPSSAVNFCKVTAGLMVGAAVLGLLRPTETLFGLLPLFGGAVWLHALIGFVAVWVGFSQRVAVTEGQRAALPRHSYNL
jgi:hypothetical protein